MRKKHKARILEIIKEFIDSQIKTDTGQVLPTGYNPIGNIRGAMFCWCMVPFNRQNVWCQLRCPNATQLEQCGDMTNITFEKDEAVRSGKDKFSYDEVIQIRNYHENICKLVLNVPTYDKVLTLVGENDFVISEKKKELEEIEKFYDANKEGMSEIEKSTVSTRIQTLRLQLGFILPDDTMAFLCKWAMGNDVTDIKKIRKENLLKAASLAKAHSKAPSDYLSGVFTDFNKNEIDTYAFSVLNEHMEEHKMVSGKYKWFWNRGKG